MAEHLALGYASTVHAAQGMTVDTSHTVVTNTTGAEALYVGMSRGRQANTAHVTTRAMAVDAPAGEMPKAVHRDPMSVLAATLEAAEPERSALATAVESAEEAASVRTPAELLADAAELATAGRTSRWFDQLLASGQLDQAQRVALAVEDGATTLTRLLRRVELAGHDPKRVLEDAVTCRPLEDARQLTNVLHHRITESVSLDPVGMSYADWIPAVEDPQWHAYLSTLAADADSRRADLGRATAEDAPQWAIEAFGPVPEVADIDGRREWEERAGAVAAHRELTGYDDPSTPLCQAPKSGQVEQYASWRAAWRALGRPEADRDELEMSDGQLRVRIRAAEREEAWAPRYVAQELAGTRQAVDSHRATAALRAAEAATTADAVARERLEQEAAEAAALAEVLDERAEQLAVADEARAQWLAHTAWTRAAAERAAAELAARGVAEVRPDEEMTAAEWLAAHHEVERAEDPFRAIAGEADLDDITAARDGAVHDAELDAAEPFARNVDVVAVEDVDVRQEAVDEPAPVERDTVQVATADDTADAVRRAQRALAELKQRRAAEAAHEASEEATRDEQLVRWHSDDVVARESAERAAADEQHFGPSLGVARGHE